MDNPFDSARLMIDAAKENITLLRDGVKAWSHNDNWAGIIEKDPESSDHIIKVQFKTDLPARLSLRAVQATANLRSALDHAAYASALITSGLDDPNRTKFIFGDTVDDLRNEIGKKRCADMHEDIIAFMLALEPHQAGNRSLWALNKMRNRSDHRILLPCAATSKGLGIGEGLFSATASNISEWSSIRKQLSFLRLHGEFQIHAQIDPFIEVELNPVFGFPSKPAVEILGDLASEVERIVLGMEAETARIHAF